MSEELPYRLILGDCIEAMDELADASVDAVVCDPPYGINFMGSSWDGVAIAAAATRDAQSRKTHGPASPSRPGRAHPRTSSAYGDPANIAGGVIGGSQFQRWCHEWAAEALRVLKPGGHLLAFGSPRTYHRLVCGIEDAGFEVRDSIMWLYGSGFPKSMDVSKAIDAAAGVDREVISTGTPVKRMIPGADQNGTGSWIKDNGREFVPTVTKAATPEAEQWEGWGTALKPAHEPVVVARKPLGGTVVANVLEHGTGALNIDGCRIGTEERTNRPAASLGNGTTMDGGAAQDDRDPTVAVGRWPANLVLSHHPDCREVGTRQVRTGTATANSHGFRTVLVGGEKTGEQGVSKGHADEDGTETIAAYDCVRGCPVAELDAQSGQSISSDRPRVNQPSESIGTFKTTLRVTAGIADKGGGSRFFYVAKSTRSERDEGLDPGVHNLHPTVKPIALMRYLCRLVTPPGGVILDPFMGSGTCGIAAVREGFRYIGIERESDYFPVAQARIDGAYRYLAEPQALF